MFGGNSSIFKCTPTKARRAPSPPRAANFWLSQCQALPTFFASHFGNPAHLKSLLTWMLWSSYAFGTRTLFGMVWACMLGSAICSWNTNGIMVWAWIFWLAQSFKDDMGYGLAHRCSGHRMVVEHERCFAWFGHGGSG